MSRVLLMNGRKPEKRDYHSPSLTEFCAETGIQFTNQLLLPEITAFRAQWKDHALAGGKKLERLRAVGRFFVDRGWSKENWALKLKRPKVADSPTLPYARSEVVALLSACPRFMDWHGHANQDNAHRLRAVVLLLRYSGLPASCAVDRLSGNRLFLYTQKTGVPVYVRYHHS